MRRLAWTALGFTAGVGLCEYVLPAGGLPYIAAALAVLCPLVRRWRRCGRQAALCQLAAAAGLLLWWGQYTLCVEPVQAIVGDTVTVTARVTDYVERHDDYERVPVRVLDGAPGRSALLYLYEGGLPELEPGDLIEAQIRLSDPVTRQGERSHLYTSQGVFLLGYIQKGTLKVTGRAALAGLRYLPRRLCHEMQTLCGRFFGADTAPFVKGLLTGDTAELEEDTENYTAMRMAGVLHIVAVSGMHMFVLVGFVQMLLGRSRRTSLVCLPVIWLFALMAGGKSSVVRAAVMQTLYLLAPILRREEDELTCLGAALLVLLGKNPMAIGGVGLQLSFACMAGYVFMLPVLREWMGRRLPAGRKIARWAAGNLAGTVCANAFSVPLAAFYFGQIPLWSLAANLLTLQVVEFVFAGALGTCVLGAVWPAAGRTLGGLLDWPARLCMWVYRSIASLPVASLAMNTVRAAVWLAGVYVLFGAWYWLRRKKRRTVPTDVPVCLSVLGLCLVLLAGRWSVGRDEALLTALDVGQGECVVLAGYEGTAVVDCGGSGLKNAGDIAADYLQSIGRTRLDVLILTHLHADHAGGVETLLYRMPVGRLVIPAGSDDGDGLLARIRTAAQARGVPVTFLEQESCLRAGELVLELLLPRGGDVNERGIVAAAELTGHRALIMGDAGMQAELELLRVGDLTPADVLVAGHHGSKSASGALMLLAVRPETAVVSVGYNSYGQPSDEALGRLQASGAAVRRTDLEGDVTVRFTKEDGADGKAG